MQGRCPEPPPLASGCSDSPGPKGSPPFFQPILAISASETTTPMCPHCVLPLLLFSIYFIPNGTPELSVTTFHCIFRPVCIPCCKGQSTLNSTACCQHGSPHRQEGCLRGQGSGKLKRGGGRPLAEWTRGHKGPGKPGLSPGTLPRKSTAGLQLPEQEGHAASSVKGHPTWRPPSGTRRRAGDQREPRPGTTTPAKSHE